MNLKIIRLNGKKSGIKKASQWLLLDMVGRRDYQGTQKI